MSLARRLFVWLALLGIALHAPLPAMPHGQQVEWLASQTICSAGGMHSEGGTTRSSGNQDDSGTGHGDMLCCLVCADLGCNHAAPPAAWAFVAQRGVVFAAPALHPAGPYRHHFRLLAPARAPPLA
ncbi:DUF2946 family protein [Ralstonia pseudosolanacearum]|nr:signal peptide protein [Ralstonia solanacearum]